jgi:Helicase conserved C-terminal domain
MMRRGVGVHHAGLLPKYRRVVEDLFVKKLLTVAVCTETLAAGINLPARSVVLTSLAKGPFGKEKLIDPSTAHQIFGRAGRPQFDKQGFVYVLAHEDDVRLLRWKEKFDAIPEDTRDPGLMKAKKGLKRKKPTKSDGKLYWTEGQFDRLKTAPPGKLYSKGPLPWRLLAYLLKVSPEVERVRAVIRKRLLDQARIVGGEKHLETMLKVLADDGFVTLEPAPPPPESGEPYRAERAVPTPDLDKLLVFRTAHPLYGAFLAKHLGTADDHERLQALESVLEMPRPLLKYVRVPRDLPPGPLATQKLDPELIKRGLMTAPVEKDPDEPEDDGWEREEDRPPTVAEKLYLLFEATHPEVGDVQAQSVWAASELLRYGGDFNAYVKSRDLTKQEGIVFRHLLRLILLCAEFEQVVPPETTEEEWRAWLRGVSAKLAASCRAVDPTSTDAAIQFAKAADVVEGEEARPVEVPSEAPAEPPPAGESSFAAGLFES